jgi:hypothetical protein
VPAGLNPRQFPDFPLILIIFISNYNATAAGASGTGCRGRANDYFLYIQYVMFLKKRSDSAARMIGARGAENFYTMEKTAERAPALFGPAGDRGRG